MITSLNVLFSPLTVAIIDSILKSHGIDKQNYHGRCLIGRHINSFMDKGELILEELWGKYEQLVLPSGAKANTKRRMELFKVMMLSFSVVMRLASQCTQITPNEKIEFTAMKDLFCEYYRIFYNNEHITPKFHVVEKHLQDYLFRVGNLGILSEECGEKLHHQKNQSCVQYCHLRNEEKKERAMDKQINIKNSPVVKATQIALKAATKQPKRKLELPHSTENDSKKLRNTTNI
jgi:hypothetical protein